MKQAIKNFILNCIAFGFVVVACSYPLLLIYALVAVVLGY